MTSRAAIPRIFDGILSIKGLTFSNAKKYCSSSDKNLRQVASIDLSLSQRCYAVELRR